MPQALSCLVSVLHTHTVTTLQPDITPGALAVPELKEEGLVRLPNTTPRIRQLDLEDVCDITDAVLKVGCRAHQCGLGCVGEGRGRSERMRCVEGAISVILTLRSREVPVDGKSRETKLCSTEVSIA